MIRRILWYCSRTSVFITFQIILLFLVVHREQVFMSASYQLQKHEALRQQLNQEIIRAQHQFHQLKSHTHVQAAARSMKLAPLSLSSIRPLYEADIA
jgi:hypothetical protein